MFNNYSPTIYVADIEPGCVSVGGDANEPLSCNFNANGSLFMLEYISICVLPLRY